MSDFALGQRVTFTHVTSRQRQGRLRWWASFRHSGEGIVIGWRTLSDGEVEDVTEWDGYGSHTVVDRQWCAKRYFRAYLVVTDLRSNPIYVRPAHLTAVADV